MNNKKNEFSILEVYTDANPQMAFTRAILVT